MGRESIGEARENVEDSQSAAVGFPWRRLAADVTPGLVLVLVALLTGLGFGIYHDERDYLMLARRFAQGINLALVLDYGGIPSALGPAYYATYGLWIRLVGDELSSARMLSLLFASMAGAVLVEIGRMAGVRHRVWFGVGIVALPHFAISGVTMLSEAMTLLMSSLTVWCWLRGSRSGREGWFLLAAVPLAFAIDLRVNLIALVPALMLVGLVMPGRSMVRVLAPTLAVLPQLPFWWLWGGLMPPTQRIGVIRGIEPRPGFNVSSLVHLATVTGFVGWPALVVLIGASRSRWKWWLLSAVAALGLYLGFRPDYSFRFAGPLASLARVHGRMLAPVLVPFAVAGGMLMAWGVTVLLDRDEDEARRTVLAVAVASLGIFILSPLAFERYALSSTPYWIAAIVPRLEGRRWGWALWRAWVIVLLMASAVSVVGLMQNRPLASW